MAIVQISKLQQRAGNIVDLPQLDEAEFGFASDAKRLFIGKVSPNENIEVLTSYSNISFSQIQGAEGNLDISAVTVDDGQILTYDGTNWVNRGGDAGGLITLGDVGNVRIDGGAIGYVLETDGTGNLTWAPKTTVTAFIQNATKTNPCVITTTEDNFFTDKAEVTITNVPGMTQLNGNSYYANVLSSNSFSLYADAAFTSPINATAYGTFPTTTVTNTTVGTNIITVTSSAAFTIGNPVQFIGTTFGGLNNNTTYYVKTKPSGTEITVSLTAGGANVTLATASGSCTVFETGGRAISSTSGSGVAAAAGSNSTVQFNNSNLLDADADFTWNNNTGGNPKILTVNGNANVGNLNATSSVIASTLTSNVSTGTAPLTVSSTSRVANLNVSYANVSDFEVVTAQTTGTFFPVFVNGSATANRALGANANLGFNAATGNLSATILYANSTITAVGNIVGANVNTAGNVTASRLISNIATGTAPLTVTSTTRVANLNVAYANVADFMNVADVSTGTYYPILANAASGNVSEGSNSALTFNAATGALNSTLLGGTLTTAAQPNVTSLGTLTSLTVSGTLTANDIATFGTAGDALNITGAGNTNVNGAGGLINIAAAQGNGTGAGGALTLVGGSANTSGNAAGGVASLTAGNASGQGQGGTVGIYSGSSSNASGGLGGNVVITGGTFNGDGGDITISAGNATSTNRTGGDVLIKAGPSTGSQAVGKITFQTSTPGSSGATVQTLADRVIIDDTQMNVRFTTASTSTTTGALEVAGGVGVVGNVYAAAFYGAATGLTGLVGANVTGTVANATHASTANTVTNATQSNITSVGTLLGLQCNSGALTTVSAPFIFDQTWNNASVVFTGIKQNITDTASSAASRLIDLQTGGVSRFYVDKVGNVVATNINSGNLLTANFITGTLTTAAQPNVTSLGTLTSLNVNGTVTAVNITANTGVFTGNGSALTALNASNISSGTLAQARLANASLTVNGQSISLGGSGTITANTTQTLTLGSFLTGTSFNGGTAVTAAVDATSANTASKVVARDASGNFSAGTITATLSGAATTAGTVTTAAQPNITSVGTLISLDVTGNITAGNLSVTSAGIITAGAITTGANTTAGNITGNWTLTSGSRFNATYADLAEYYEGDQHYEAGTVLEFGGEKEVTIAGDSSNKVAGVVSTDPAFAMHAKCHGIAIPIALQGRVPVKVRGVIRKGDMMVSGGNGYARPCNSPIMGSVIGKALQNFDGGEGVIEIAIGRL